MSECWVVFQCSIALVCLYVCLVYIIFPATGRAHRYCQASAATSTHVVRGSVRHSSWWWTPISSRQTRRASSHGELSLTISWHTTVRPSKNCSVSSSRSPLKVLESARFFLSDFRDLESTGILGMQTVKAFQTVAYLKYTGWAKKTGLFLEVCNSRICWHRIAFYISNFSDFYPE